MILFSPRVLSRMLLPVWLVLLLFPVTVQGDTVILRDGGKVRDCRVLEKRSDGLVVRTRSGRMVIPNDLIKKIKKKECVFDIYDRKVAAVSDNANGIYEVAEWCRKQGGLRPEMDELLERAIALDPNHAESRHLMGQVWDGQSWVELPPLSIALVMENHEELQQAVKTQLSIVMDIRKDLQFVDSLDDVKAAHGCELVVNLFVKKTRTAKFYRLRVKGPAIHTKVKLKPRGKLAGRESLEIKLRGEVSNSLPDARAKAIGDAFVRKPRKLHGMFDELQRRRILLVEAALARAREKTGSGEE